MEPPTGGGVDVIGDRKRDVFIAMPPVDATSYVRGQYRGYLDVPGVAPGSSTETFCAMRLEVHNWRWAGVPFFIRAGKSMPATITEVRLIFKHPPRLGFAPPHARQAEPNALVLRISPKPGARIRLQVKRPDAFGLRDIHLDMDFARQYAVEETWRVMQPALDAPHPVEVYEPGWWGPASARRLLAHRGAWHEPWLP